MPNLVTIFTLICWWLNLYLPIFWVKGFEYPFTEEFKYGHKIAEVTNLDLNKVSGMAASKKNEGFIWVNNEHGDMARIFLLDTMGNIARYFYLKHARNVDWEDMAVGPGPISDESYLYIGDIGSIDKNHPPRQTIDIYRFKEPSLNDADSLITEYDKIVMQYPDTTHDAETLMIDPLSKNIYIITNKESNVGVYEAPNLIRYNQNIKLSYLGKLPFEMITAGDISPSGNEILLKNYLAIFYWKRQPNQTIFQTLVQEHQLIRYAREPLGKALTWKKDGNGFYTLSKKTNKKQFLYYYSRK